MKIAKFRSDYGPETILTIIRNDDGDIVLRIHGKDEMRIAMEGGTLHGEEKVRVIKAFEEIIEVLNAREEYRK